VSWPVFLGRVKRTPADLAPYAVLEQPLPYITLRGELVVSPAAHGPQPQPTTTPAAGQNGAAEPDQAKPPSNRVRMQIGAELATERRRFAVSLPDTSGAYVDRLAIKADGSALLGGPTTLRNDLDLTIAGAAEFRPLKAPPKAAAPWQVYHVKTTKDGVESHELRVEIANPGKQGDPANTIFVVGGVQANQFKAALRVAADGTVTIGTLMVRGQVVEQPIDADPNDPRFGAKLAAQLSQGLPIQSNIKIEIVALANGVPLTDPTKNVAVGAALTYKVKLTNTTTTQMTEVQVYANQRIASFNKLALTPLHGQPRTLRPGESFEIDDSNLAKLTVPPVPNDTNQDIQLVISAVGRAGAQGSAFGSATSVVHIVEK
jgi:hypothetical protein